MRRGVRPLGMRRGLRVAVAAVIVLLIGAGVWVVASGSLTADDRAATPSPDASPSGPDAANDGDLAWWRTDPQPDGDVAVRIGTLGRGETAAVELAMPQPAPGPMLPFPSVIGAAAGQVVLLEPDGRGSRLRVVDAASGAERALVQSQDAIHDAVVVEDEVLFVTVDPLDGTPHGVWAVPLAGGQPEPIDGLTAQRPAIRLAAIAEWVTDLAASADGRRVALFHCVRMECEMWWVDRDDGASGQLPMAFGAAPDAIIGDVAVLRDVCVAEDCSVALLDLVSGETRPLPDGGAGSAWRAVAVPGPQPLVAASIIGAGGVDGPATVDVVDLSTMAVRRQVIGLAMADLVTASPLGIGMETPAGAVLVAGRARGAAPDLGFFLVEVATGDVTPVPVLGTVPIQG